MAVERIQLTTTPNSGFSAAEPHRPAPAVGALGTAIRLMERSRFPMFLLAGSGRTMFYNDAYVPILQGKHPDAFGKGFYEVWPEVRDEIEPVIDRAFEGEASFFEDLAVELNRDGRAERAYFTFSYSPVEDDGGQVIGVLCTCIETTSHVIAAGRSTFLLELEQSLRTFDDPVHVILAAEEALGRHLGVSRVGYGSVDATGRYFTTSRNWTDGSVSHHEGTHDLLGFGADIMAAIQRGDTLIINDVTRDERTNGPDQLAAFAYLETSAAVTVSLIKHGRLEAAMYVHQRTARRWSQDEVRLIEDVAERTWAAVERALAEQRLRGETEALEVLNRVGSAIAAELELDRIVQTVTDAGVELTGAQFGAFFYNVLDDTGGSYMLYALSGAPREAFARFAHPRATAVFKPTFDGAGVVRSDNILKDARYGQNHPHRGMPPGHLPVRSYLSVPVISRSGEVLGRLFFGHEQAGVFSDRAERIVVGIAAQAAIAIDNARLFQSAQQELARRVEAEKHQRLLIDELNHRVKNTLATVQSIASQTLRTADKAAEAKEALESRLFALSRAHDVLTRENWDGADLGEVVDQVVAPYASRGEGRLHVRGEAVRLTPRMALALAMALQELATNAVKYGALSNASGWITIEWQVDRSVIPNCLRLHWEEAGGPLVKQPSRRGFGSRLIERSLAHDLNGTAQINFVETGLVCTVNAPLE